MKYVSLPSFWENDTYSCYPAHRQALLFQALLIGQPVLCIVAFVDNSRTLY